MLCLVVIVGLIVILGNWRDVEGLKIGDIVDRIDAEVMILEVYNAGTVLSILLLPGFILGPFGRRKFLEIFFDFLLAIDSIDILALALTFATFSFPFAFLSLSFSFALGFFVVRRCCCSCRRCCWCRCSG